MAPADSEDWIQQVLTQDHLNYNVTTLNEEGATLFDIL